VIENIASLVRARTSEQAPIEFKPTTWQPLLNRWPTAEKVLTDDRFSSKLANQRRAVGRDHLRDLVATTDIAVPEQVLAAFTLIIVWGSGVRSRSYRYLPQALSAPDCAEQLRASALACRAGDLASAYEGMRLPGIGSAFFTKWFAFAGTTPDGVRRPLILDARVWKSLNQLGITRRSLGYRTSPAKRYVAYVELLHEWADELRHQGITVDAERLEFVLFAHNRQPLPVGDAA
jgi:8-oxoguanine DNA glycosylase-like protein